MIIIKNGALVTPQGLRRADLSAMREAGVSSILAARDGKPMGAQPGCYVPR